MGKIYDTAESKANERRVMASVSRRFGVEGKKLPEFSEIDFVISRNGKGWGWAEVKCRWNLSTDYPTYMIDLAKVEALRAAASGTDSHARIIVRWDDYLGVVDAATCTYTTGWGGRTDRNDPLDRDMMAYIPVSCFTMYPLEDLEGMTKPEKH